MALPELLLPATLPPFKADDFVITPEEMYAPVARQNGQPRKRRLFVSVPRVVDASIETNQAGLETFFSWHETALQAGALPFSARVAKVGSGVEYWEAYVLGYTVEHREGANNHIITMKLRLKGQPSSSPPAATSLGVEFSGALTAYRETPDYALFVEFAAGLEFTSDQGASLGVEYIAHLYTEANGPQTGIPLDVDFFAHLEMYSGDAAFSALAVEFSAALEALAQNANPLAVEFSAGLALSLVSTGYVASPGALSATGILAGSLTQNAQAVVQVRSDGTIYKRQNTGAYTLHANWYTPLLAGVGTGKWVRFTVTTGAAPSAGSTGVALSLSSNREWSLSAAYGQAFAGTGLIEIATDPDITNVVSSFTVSLDAENTP